MIFHMRTPALGPKRRFFFLLLVYATGLGASLATSFLLRFEGQVPAEQWQIFARSALWLIPLQLALLWKFGQFRALLSYFSLPDAQKIAAASALAYALSLVLWSALPAGRFWSPSRGIALMSFINSVFILGMARTAFRILSQRVRDGGAVQARRRVLILGAGDVGADLARELSNRPGLALDPVGFLDDDRAKRRARLHGLPILGRLNDLPKVSERKRIDSLILAMPSAGPAKVREILRVAEQCGLPCQTVPSMQQLVNGHVHVERIRPVDVEDLLLRPEVPLLGGDVQKMIRGHTVLVTGAGGSIGGELCRQILGLGPAKLILVERNEFALYVIEQELREDYPDGPTLPLAHDCGDETKIRELLARERPALLFHAAAHKHVPLLEHQPIEAVENNSLKTLRLARWAAEHGVEKFILVSTDKAIRPTSVMGASKRLAELALQSAQAAFPQTQFISVRFGNVLGSSGSVVPLFKKQIAAGGPVTVTHPEVTRYFMSVSEAAGLILQAAYQGAGGEIFVLDMGEPIKIADLARELIRLSGLREGQDIAIRFTGLRPGEKMFEELRYDHESAEKTACQRIWRQRSGPVVPEKFPLSLEELCRKNQGRSAADIRRAVQRLVPEYQPAPEPPKS